MKRKAQVSIHIGGVFATREPTVIKTLLGSCIAACLRDPEAGVGGMNHFMLPAALNGNAEDNLSRFGLHAMELLIGEIQKLGGSGLGCKLRCSAEVMFSGSPTRPTEFLSRTSGLFGSSCVRRRFRCWPMTWEAAPPGMSCSIPRPGGSD